MDSGLVGIIMGSATSILVAICSVVGVVITNNKANNKMLNDNKTNQAVMKERLDELTREVREHNGFAVKIPVIEQKIKALEKVVFNGKE